MLVSNAEAGTLLQVSGGGGLELHEQAARPADSASTPIIGAGVVPVRRMSSSGRSILMSYRSIRSFRG